MTNHRIKAPIFAISRLRMGTDGSGITTLVTFMGCPLEHYVLVIALYSWNIERNFVLELLKNGEGLNKRLLHFYFSFICVEWLHRC